MNRAIDSAIDIVHSALTGNRRDVDITDRLYGLLVRSGVTALVWRAVEEKTIVCPTMSRETAIRWVLSADRIVARYRKHKLAAEHLTELYRQNNIRTLILKGVGLSLYYPHPETRESGDIDVYLFGDTKRGTSLAAETQVKETSKHDIFCFEGVMVENHIFFATKRQTNDDLLLLLDKYGVVERDGLLFPSAQFNILFNVRHSATHCGGAQIPLRQIVDWALLLKGERDSLNEELRIIIRRNRLSKMFDAMTVVAERLVGENFSDLLFNPRKAQRYAEILLSLLDKVDLNNKANTLSAKVKNLIKKRKNYILSPDSYWVVVWKSIVAQFHKI